MQTLLEHHLPPCLSHIAIEYMSGTREHWAYVFTVMVLSQFAHLSKVDGYNLRVLNKRLRARLYRPRNVHDRRDCVMCEVDGNTQTDYMQVPSCREFSIQRAGRVCLNRDLNRIPNITNVRCEITFPGLRLTVSEPTLRAALVWEHLSQHMDASSMDHLLIEHEHFQTWDCPGWATYTNQNDEESCHFGWCVKVRGEDRWLPTLKNIRTVVSNRS